MFIKKYLFGVRALCASELFVFEVLENFIGRGFDQPSPDSLNVSILIFLFIRK